MERARRAEPLQEALARKTTLYFSARAGTVKLRGRSLLVSDGAGREQAFPLAQIRRIGLLGRARLEPDILYLLMRRATPVDWLDSMGRPLGQLLAFADSSANEVIRQANFQNTENALLLAKILLLVKLENCQRILRRRVGKGLPWQKRKLAILEAADAESLRGAEGMAAKMYFGQWQELIRPFEWHGRQAHPAPDPVNMLLSLGYGLVHNRLASALHSTGLNPRIGFFHLTRGRHCALASDLLEPFRALVDNTVLSLVRLKEISPGDFRLKGAQCVCADSQLFGRLLGWFEEMFSKPVKFCPAPFEPHLCVERSLNDALDDLAESFGRHLASGDNIFLPRLTP